MTSTPSDPTPEGAVPPPPAGTVPPPAGAVPPPGYAPGYGTPQPPMSDSDQRMWAMLAHLGGIILGFIAPLVIWLMYRERGRFVEEQAKEALNFQITFTIAMIISGILFIVLIGMILMPIVVIAGLIFMIMGAVAANRGEAYRYPVNVRLIK